MLLNFVHTFALTIALGFFSITAIKADDTFFDDSATTDNQNTRVSNVLSEDLFNTTDDQDSPITSQLSYSLDDEDDDFD